jgi:Lon protease-like protein
MFPLENVLFPAAPLHLHIFEERYRALARDSAAGDGTFGVVLIERGSEVGGGDSRFGVGTMARVTQAAELPDGQWLITAVGEERFRVRSWVAEEPYPQAEVEPFPDAPVGDDSEARLQDAQRLLRRALALRAELGERVPPATVELGAEPGPASYQAAALAGFSPVDAQRVLEGPGPDDRLAVVIEVLDDLVEVLGSRLASG